MNTKYKYESLTKEQYDEMLAFYIQQSKENETSYHIWRAIACVCIFLFVYVMFFILSCLLLTKI